MLERTNQKRRVTTSKQVQSRLSRPFRKSGNCIARIGHFRFDAKSQTRTATLAPAPLRGVRWVGSRRPRYIDTDKREVARRQNVCHLTGRGAQARYAISGAACCAADVRRRTDSPSSRTWGAHRLTRKKDGEEGPPPPPVACLRYGSE